MKISLNLVKLHVKYCTLFFRTRCIVSTEQNGRVCCDISVLDDYLQGILGEAHRDLSRLRADVGISRLSTANISF